MNIDRKKILIIEDDNMINSMYKTRFEAEGFEVFVADNGGIGLELAKTEKPDIIILDVILPQLDGFSVLDQIKKDKTTKNIQVIMLTNLGTEEDKEKGKAMGAFDYLVKASLTPGQVSEKIKQALKILK
ncbi:response regulator [Patescibacteria group bacterium]|nr:response regulator [Patescibacteria group bacterium]MBU1663630.1 response regulator [Patescibacteria group bacterium]MBU1933878.1 response regulator [Patescibacteria group bacterium]MBU2007763.1 response regulator [Patescibacteria group bacterium]MBU2233418.1 response regulator [Patescibacteria group bacterium]